MSDTVTGAIIALAGVALVQVSTHLAGWTQHKRQRRQDRNAERQKALCQLLAYMYEFGLSAARYTALVTNAPPDSPTRESEEAHALVNRFKELSREILVTSEQYGRVPFRFRVESPWMAEAMTTFMSNILKGHMTDERVGGVYGAYSHALRSLLAFERGEPAIFNVAKIFSRDQALALFGTNPESGTNSEQ